METLNKNDNRKNIVDVLVLGGGLAGLGAAITFSNLNKNGHQISYLVLEAQNQAGGRVKSEKLLKFNSHNRRNLEKSKISCDKQINFVDTGAQWLHGRNNFLYAIAENYKLLTSSQSEEGLGCFLNENCGQIDANLVKKVDFKIGQILEECEQFAKNKNTKIYPKSVGHFLRERFQKFADNLEDLQERKQAMNLFEWHLRFQIIDNSCRTLDHLSAKYWGKYSFNGEPCQAHYNFKYGFHSVVDNLTRLLNNDTIHYNKDVIEIQICKKQAEQKNSMDNPNKLNISVKCSDGSMYFSKSALVTFSLGVLKKTHTTLFQPSLPSLMVKAIESIGFDTINKIFLEFDQPWWHDLDGIQFVWKSGHNNENTHWTHYLTGFDIFRPENGNILLGWVGGDGAIEMESLSDIQIVEDCINLLAKFTHINVPMPIRYYCTRWYSDPFIQGAYSYISIDCDENDVISDRLMSRAMTYDDFYSETKDGNNETLDKNLPIVLFAGEACHEKYFSTAHGAFISGIEQAQKMIKSLSSLMPNN